MSSSFHTADGYSVQAGDHLFVVHGDGAVEVRVVSSVVDKHRVLWTEKDSHGYEGARWNTTYKDANKIPQAID